MLLSEAIETLEKAGYEVEPLNEGKIGRTLAAGALALGLATGNANAINQDDIARFEKQTELASKNVLYNDAIYNSNYEITKNNNKITISVFDKGEDLEQEIIVSKNGDFKVTDYIKSGDNYEIRYGNNPNGFEIIKEMINELRTDNNDSSKQNTYIQYTFGWLCNNQFTKKVERYITRTNEIRNVTVFKNGKPYKTLCPDGSSIKGDGVGTRKEVKSLGSGFTYTLDKDVDNCTGEDTW